MSYRNSVDMHDFFNDIRKSLSSKGIAKYFPSIMEEIALYESHLSSHCLKDYPIGWGQLYQAVINDSTGKSLFSLEWDISQIQQHIGCLSIPLRQIDTEDNVIYCDVSKLYLNKVQEYIDIQSSKKLEPIFLVWIEFIQMYYIIDGNHRFFASKQSGRKTIDAIIIPANIHLKYMLSDESKMRYKIFHNIAVMANVNLRTKYVVPGSNEDHNSLYSISDNKISLGSIQHFLSCTLLSAWQNIAKIKSILNQFL